MPVFTASSPHSLFSRAEFTPKPEGNEGFFFVAPEQAEQARELLERLGQRVAATASSGGKTVLVAHGDDRPQALMQALAESGAPLAPTQAKAPFNIWALRGNLSMTGQLLQLVSSVLGNFDPSTLVFALLNISANTSNIVFGGQKTPDTHQLRVRKEELNERLAPYAEAQHALLPTPNETRLPLHIEQAPPATLGQKFHHFMQSNSSSVGEVLPRLAGSLTMIFPYTGIPHVIAALKGGERGPKALFEASQIKSVSRNEEGRILDIAYNTQDNRVIGLCYTTGKMIALTSQVADPFNPVPANGLSTFREKWTFRLSTLIETTAAFVLAQSRFRNVKTLLDNRTDDDTKKIAGQLAGGVGGLLFTAGLATRFFAPYGERELDMKELQAHAIDGLAQLSPEQLPQLAAETAGWLSEVSSKHGRPSIPFGEAYRHIVDGLYKDYQIAMPLEQEFTQVASRATPVTVATHEMPREPHHEAHKTRQFRDLAEPSSFPSQPAVSHLAAASASREHVGAAQVG